MYHSLARRSRVGSTLPRLSFKLTTFLDDGIVVVRVRKGDGSMSAVRALREKLGDEAMGGLHLVINDAGRAWKDEVLAIAGEKFEKRLAQEIGSLRIDMAKEFAALRVEMANASASMLKWSFLFWIGQFAAVSAMMAFLLRTIGPR